METNQKIAHYFSSLISHLSFLISHFSSLISLNIVPSTPLINPGLPSAPYFLPNSTASSIATFGGVFFSTTSSQVAKRMMAKSILLILSIDHSGAAAVINRSIFLLCLRIFFASRLSPAYFGTKGNPNNDLTASCLRTCLGSVAIFTG